MTDLLSELGFDPDDQHVVETREDVVALMDLVYRLVELRKEAGLTQAQVAARMGTTQSAVSDFERLGGDPRQSTIQRYARAVDARLELGLRRRATSGDWLHEWITDAEPVTHVSLSGPSSTWRRLQTIRQIRPIARFVIDETSVGAA